MAPKFLKRASVLFFAGLLASAGCNSSGGSNGKDATVLGTLAGTVTNSSGAAISGVVVTPTPAVVPATTTDSSGKFSLSVPAGSYTLSFSGDNLEPATSASATVTAATTTTVDQVMAASSLKVTVSLPAALLNGGPAGFNTTVSGITASATQNGSAVTPDSITWTITDYYGISDPPTTATPSPATGDTTSFDIADFESVRQGANAWLNDRYGLSATVDKSDFQAYVQAPERDQLLSFGVQQVRAMSYKLIATVKSGSHTSTGSAVVAPLTISSGVNTLPLGMMVVANAPSTATYNWTLGFLPMTATSETYTDVTASLQGATTKNPYIVPTVIGVYKLANGSDAPLYFRISTYSGAGTSDTDKSPIGVACADCHKDPHSLADKFADWNASAHANFNWENPLATPMSLFESGVTGVQGTHYTESCISCHVVGYSKVPTAVNDGWDDVAASVGWKFPTTYDDAAWATVTAQPALLHRAGIQCENCHGPLEPADHSQPEGIPSLFSKPLAPVASMSAGVCMYCHDALTNHDKGPLWASSPHANTQLALDEATAEGRGTGVNHCGRCHAAEGFLVYAQQQQAGNWDVIARPTTIKSLLCDPADTKSPCTPIALPNTTSPRACIPDPSLAVDPACACAQKVDWQAAGLTDPTKLTGATSKTCYKDPEFYSYLKDTVGLSKNTVHSQTCQTCHDPHSTELRVNGNTKTTAGLFSVSNAGAGALCMICHNSRSAAIKQGTNTITSWSRLGPHNACQGDMFAGRNAFFISNLSATDAPGYTPNISAHSFMSDTCADCHVLWVPPDIKAQFNPISTNHTFRSSTQICAQCHGPDIGDLVQAGITDKMSSLSDALSGVLYKKLTAGSGFDTAAKSRTDPTTGATLTDPASLTVAPSTVRTIVAVQSTDAVIVALNDGSQFQIGLDKINAVGKTSSLFDLTEANTQTVAKAYFNLLFVADDGAKGVHNPKFAGQALDNATAALGTATIP